MDEIFNIILNGKNENTDPYHIIYHNKCMSTGYSHKLQLDTQTKRQILNILEIEENKNMEIRCQR